MKIIKNSLLTHGSGPYYSILIADSTISQPSLRFSWGGYGYISGPGGCFQWMPSLEFNKPYAGIVRFSWLCGSITFVHKDYGRCCNPFNFRFCLGKPNVWELVNVTSDLRYEKILTSNQSANPRGKVMTRTKAAKIMSQVLKNRAARRVVEIELGLNKVHSQVHMTSKRDVKRSNTIRLTEVN